MACSLIFDNESPLWFAMLSIILSEKELSNIEKPDFADDDKIREHSLYLSACQFNIDEFKNGYAVKQIEQLQHDQTYTNFKWSIV